MQELGLSDKLHNVRPFSFHLNASVALTIFQLPENNALQGLCSGMLEAWKIYGDPNAVILFVIEDVTYNICDQRFHEFEIRRLNANAKVIRRTLTQIAQQAKLGPSNELLM